MGTGAGRQAALDHPYNGNTFRNNVSARDVVLPLGYYYAASAIAIVQIAISMETAAPWAP